MTKDCDGFREDECTRREENGTVREGLSEIDHPIATEHLDIELSTVALCFNRYESQPNYTERRKVAKDTDYPFIPSKLYRAGRKLNINIWDH
jgi:hypothetical protein